MLRLLRNPKSELETPDAEAPPGQQSDPLWGLVARVVQGERAAEQTLLNAVGPAVLGIVRRVLGANHSEVDDVCQEAAVGLLSALPCELLSHGNRTRSIAWTSCESSWLLVDRWHHRWIWPKPMVFHPDCLGPWRCHELRPRDEYEAHAPSRCSAGSYAAFTSPDTASLEAYGLSQWKTDLE